MKFNPVLLLFAQVTYTYAWLRDRTFELTNVNNAACFPIYKTYASTAILLKFDRKTDTPRPIPLILFNYTDINAYTNLPTLVEFTNTDDLGLLKLKENKKLGLNLVLQKEVQKHPETVLQYVLKPTHTDIQYSVPGSGHYCIYLPTVLDDTINDNPNNFVATATIRHAGPYIPYRNRIIFPLQLLSLLLQFPGILIGLSRRRKRGFLDVIEFYNMLLFSLYPIGHTLGLILRSLGIYIGAFEWILFVNESPLSFLPYAFMTFICAINCYKHKVRGNYFWLAVSSFFQVLSILFKTFQMRDLSINGQSVAMHQGWLMVGKEYRYFDFNTEPYSKICCILAVVTYINKLLGRVLTLFFTKRSSKSREDARKINPDFWDYFVCGVFILYFLIFPSQYFSEYKCLVEVPEITDFTMFAIRYAWLLTLRTIYLLPEHYDDQKHSIDIEKGPQKPQVKKQGQQKWD
ncbi:uncharacterized protein RJT20DRAFT_24460 [Scheffersomyces xylosifermentans]|uniref:uncharacterized protein n=1 Tax=Scheffersomyces xylosifermentans TaxID=1304137 RepID=UPI00315D9FF3